MSEVRYEIVIDGSTKTLPRGSDENDVINTLTGAVMAGASWVAVERVEVDDE